MTDHADYLRKMADDFDDTDYRDPSAGAWMSDILKTTSYHIDDDNGLMLSQSGSLWTISVDTTDGVIEFEMTTKAACAMREFFENATCDACKAAPEPAKQQEAAQRRLTAGCSDCGGECGQLDGSGDARGSDRHVAPLADIMTAIETGCDMVTYSLRPQSNAQQTVDAMHAAVALLRETVMRYTGPTVTVDARSLETGEPVPVSVTVRKVNDPLDESDHRPRHDMDGDHWVRVTDMVGDAEACGWATGGPDGSSVNDVGELDAIFGPLTFCDCP